MPSPKHAASTFLLAAAAFPLLALAAPAPPAAKEDPSHPDFASCRQSFAEAVDAYDPLSHPPAPEKLSRDGDLSYQRAREYTQKLQAAFDQINTPAYRQRCEPHLRNKASPRTDYLATSMAMSKRLAWHQAALDTHCQGHASHSRQVGQTWLAKYRSLKTMQVESPAVPTGLRRFLSYEMTEFLQAKGTVGNDAACRMFAEAEQNPRENHSRAELAAMKNRCLQDQAEYRAAFDVCGTICARRDMAPQCNTFWTK